MLPQEAQLHSLCDSISKYLVENWGKKAIKFISADSFEPERACVLL